MAILSADAFARGVQLRHLRCLVAVAQERHLARAAERLALSQPAVSKTLAELEALAGTRLVERGGAGRRGVQGLAPAGEQLLVHALRVLEAVDASALAIAPATGAQVQRLRIGALPSVAPALLPGALAEFRAQWPHVRLIVQSAANGVLLDALRAGELDLVAGRMSDPRLMTGLSFELLQTEPLVFVARAGHPLARDGDGGGGGAGGSAARVAAVLACPLVVYGDGTIPRHTTESFLSALGLALPPATLQTLDVSVARAVVARSDAVWITPLGAARADLEEGRLVRLPIDTTGTEEPVGLLVRSDAEPSALRGAMAGLLREAARGLAAAGAPSAGRVRRTGRRSPGLGSS
ncbi:LysR substrate-binding domain-containing protein [Variovorax sp. PvP013]|uniref:LysR substrate-binding domain-containing protein n=1 Tax=Variovorax sp. PvP013 TaxID=3156435 RepID=UPI003D1B9047